MGEYKLHIEGLSEEILSFYEEAALQRISRGREALHHDFIGNEKPFSIARSGSHIIGMSAYIRSSMQFGGKSGTAFQAVDSYIAKSYRGKGLFKALAEKYSEHTVRNGGDLVWGFPNANAAPAWFGGLRWSSLGQVPMLIKPLRAGYMLRRIGLPGDFPIDRREDNHLRSVESIESSVQSIWEEYSSEIGCSVVRDQRFLNRRLLEGPNKGRYRVVAVSGRTGALVATCLANKHGGKIAYIMEAMGGGVELRDTLSSEVGKLRNKGAELAFAWSYPWSPNYKPLRECGFIPFPNCLRPIKIHFGGRPMSVRGSLSALKKNWYLSYLDSDTV